MPVAYLSNVFTRNIQAAQQASQNAAATTLGFTLRHWMLGDLTLWNGEPLEVQSISSAFDRTEAANIYMNSLRSPLGSVGDAASAKLQSDHLAVMERSFRVRHATPVRCAAYAAARRTGQSHSRGRIGRVQTFAQDMIVSGSVGFNVRK